MLLGLAHALVEQTMLTPTPSGPYGSPPCQMHASYTASVAYPQCTWTSSLLLLM